MDRIGLLICYEGIYPELTGDWAQLDKLKAEGADAILWAIGGVVSDKRHGEKIARKYNVAVVAAEDRHAAAFIGADGKPMSNVSTVSVPLVGGGLTNYTGQVSMVAAEVGPGGG